MSQTQVLSRKDKLVMKLTTEGKYRSMLTQVGNFFNNLGIYFMVSGRKFVRFINQHLTDEESDNFVIRLTELHRKIKDILKRQKRDYPDYSYFYGHPYQALGILGVYGERPSEERFDLYDLGNLVTKDDYVLDIGCNCGFMSVLTSFRTGARTFGIDINPYMIEIGQECAKFLNIDDKVELQAIRMQDFSKDSIKEPFTVVYSFATHWTDDENYRVALEDHLMKIHSLMADNGLLVFETHCADVGNEEFYKTLETMRDHFEWDGCRTTDKGERELYLMRRK